MSDYFWGYRRSNGEVGVRNHVLVMPTIVCANQVAENVCKLIRGTTYVHHQHGCAQVGADWQLTFDTFTGFGANPNVAGVVVIGLGCEGVSSDKIAQAIAKRVGPGRPVEWIGIQQSGGTLEALSRASRAAMLMVQDASCQQREKIAVEELIFATECGGSDACSGLSANPCVGVVSDHVVHNGGTVILAETTELIGAEHLLEGRAINLEVAEKLFSHIDRRERESMAMGVDMRGAQPAPGNIAGGLTTIEEKSLGTVAKGGTTPLMDVIEFAQRPRCKGLVHMDTPGHDIEQITGMVAGGAQVVAFTSGRGTPTSSPIAPTIKVATNTRAYENMRDNFDFNAGVIVDGTQDLATTGRELYEEMLRICSGKLTKAEIMGHHEFGLSRVGPTL